MVRIKKKWRFLSLLTLLILNVFTKSSPIEKNPSALVVFDPSLPNLNMPKLDRLEVISDSETKTFKSNVAVNVRPSNETVLTKDATKISTNRTRSLIRNIRPGQTVLSYSVKISFDGDMFNGEVVINLQVDSTDDPIIFHQEALNIDNVRAGIYSEDNAQTVHFDPHDGIIEIFLNNPGGVHIVVIEYSGEISNFGKGIFQGGVNDYRYVGMNLFPTNARRVFPCVDELQAVTTITFIFEDVPFDAMVSNSKTEDNNPNQFRALQGPPHLWGMLAHNFIDIAMSVSNVILYVRPGLNQDSLASMAIETFFHSYTEKLNQDYFQINANQDGKMHIFALPDINVEWNALSTICIWEPYILMRNIHSVMQRKIALVKIAEAMARQWFGYVVYPMDWKDQWMISGLASYAAQEVVTDFQSSDNEDIVLLDMNTIFTTDVVQEALLLDSYSSAVVIYPEDDMFDEVDIRRHILGLQKFKAPAIMRMLRLVLGDEDNDYILRAGQTLLNQRTLAPTSVTDFLEAVNSIWPGNDNIDDIGGFLEPWIQNTGYPVLNVRLLTDNIVSLTQEHFSFTDSETVRYIIPVTFTTNQQQNYNDIYPTVMIEDSETMQLPNTLNEDDYVIFNIQGQGYYRVNYNVELWNRIISALADPDMRQEIHPLNRASLLDDALNLARADKLAYDVALRLVLTWAHETEYGPWKAFIRNMEFLKKMLLSAVSDNGDLDSNIYMRMVRKTIGTFESEVSFRPNPSIREPAMTSLTRGIVMDHVCRSNYEPCIAAAIDWFYDTNSDELDLNLNIPVDIQPAVFCTMIRESGAEATNLLYTYLETNISHYDRLIVLESLACSHDDPFINGLMMDTISEDGLFGSEERSIVLAAIIRSRSENVFRVIDFMRANTNSIRDMYGGPQKLEELLFVLADNIVNDRLENNFRSWINSNVNDLDESLVIARRALINAQNNLQWTRRSLDEVYMWIDVNDAHTSIVSFTLLCFTAFICLFNL